MQIKKKQMRQTFLGAMFFAVCPMTVVLAQPKPLSANPAQDKPTLATTTAKLLLSSPALMAQVKEEQIVEDQTDAFVKTGDEFAKSGNWRNAQNAYQQALDLWSDNMNALYGLAQCSQVAGDTAKATEYFRKAVYSNNPAGTGFRENHVDKLMEFALLLNQAKQTDEALSVYNHAASLLDYEDSQYNGGKPYLKVLLPEIVMERTLPDQVRYTPERLQALADAALAYEEYSFGSDKEAVAHMQEAVKLYPDSPVTNYYLGEALLGTDNAGAKAAYQKAVELGDDATVAAAKERIEIFR